MQLGVQDCAKCGNREYAVAFSTRCGHFYHKSCYEKCEVMENSWINCVKCSRKLSKYYEVEARLYEIRSLLCVHPKVYDCYKYITVFEKVPYDWHVLREVVNLGWDINDIKYGGPGQFFQACKNDNIERMNLLIDFGFDYEKYGLGALAFACSNSSFNAFQRLLELGIEPEPKHMFIAIHCKRTDMLKRLIDQGLKVDGVTYKGKHMIHSAMKTGSVEIINVLIEKGVDWKAVDNEGNSIFHYASRYNKDEELLKEFIGSGFDFNHQNNRKVTPLITAIILKNVPVFELLVKQKEVNLNLGDSYGHTPLHYCVLEKLQFKQTLKFMESLIKGGANVNAKNYCGKTPLHMVQEGTESHLIVKLLVDNGADMHALDNKGNKPFYYIKYCLDSELVKRFINAEADRHKFEPMQTSSIDVITSEFKGANFFE